MLPPWLRGSPRLTFNSNVNIVWDGNSLVFGKGSTSGQTLPVQTAALSPVSGSGATSSAFATNGHKWSDMEAGASQIDGAWVSGKTNILIFWEHINSIWVGGLTASESIEQMAAYIAARRAVHPWIVMTLTSLPAEGYDTAWSQATRDAVNASLDEVNATMRANRATLGIDSLVDVRQSGSVFDLSSYTSADFDATGSIWFETDNTRLHLNNAGYAIVAGMVAEKLAALRRRVL